MGVGMAVMVVGKGGGGVGFSSAVCVVARFGCFFFSFESGDF